MEWLIDHLAEQGYLSTPTDQSEAIRDLATALEESRKVFAWYAEMHSTKGTPEGDDKAKRNLDFANKAQEALQKHQRRISDGDICSHQTFKRP
jgi:hypothetical protein